MINAEEANSNEYEYHILGNTTQITVQSLGSLLANFEMSVKIYKSKTVAGFFAICKN